MEGGLATPYWIVRAPSALIRRHEDVFSPQALCLYAAVFRIENPSPGKALSAAGR